MTAIAARVAVPQEHVHIARWSAAMGGLAWFLALPLLHAWGRLGWAEAMLLLAALVIVPLGFGLIEVPVRGGRPPRVWHWAVRWQLATALLLVASLGCSVPWAVVLSVPYVLVTCLAALAGAGRFLGRLSLREREAFRGELVIFRGPTLRVGHLSAPDSESQATPRGARGDTPGLHPLCIDAALVYLPGGAIGHVLSLLDTPLLGFEPVIVRLTAVHLHYVGFALPLLAGLTVGQVRRSSPRPSDISSGLCVAVVLGSRWWPPPWRSLSTPPGGRRSWSPSCCCRRPAACWHGGRCGRR
jgi:hypothetical protein